MTKPCQKKPEQHHGHGIKYANQQLRTLRTQVLRDLSGIETLLIACREVLRDHDTELGQVTARESMAVFREVETYRDIMNTTTHHLIAAHRLTNCMLKPLIVLG